MFTQRQFDIIAIIAIIDIKDIELGEIYIWYIFQFLCLKTEITFKIPNSNVIFVEVISIWHTRSAFPGKFFKIKKKNVESILRVKRFKYR